MTATAFTAAAAVGQETCGQYEEPGARVEIARLAVTQRLGMRGQDLGAPRMIEGQAGQVRLGERTLGHGKEPYASVIRDRLRAIEEEKS